MAKKDKNQKTYWLLGGFLALSVGLAARDLMTGSGSAAADRALDKVLARITDPTERDMFRAAIVDTSRRLGIEPGWLAAHMLFESGLNPSVKNAQSGATGLIQFMPATAADLGTSTAALAKMTRLEQMPYVEKYFEGMIKAVGKPRSFTDMYLIGFYPLAVKKGPDYILGSQAGAGTVRAIAAQNAIFAKDGVVKKQYVIDYIQAWYTRQTA